MSRPLVVVLMLCASAAIVSAIVLLGSRDSGDDEAVRPVTDRAELDRVGAAALALVGYQPAALGYDIRFAPGRAGVRAQTDRASRTISVFVRRDDLPHVVAHDIAHELGHAYDQSRMNDMARNAYLAERGVATAPWRPDTASDYAVGAGDFAEVFALCHSASPDFRSELAARPDDPCELLPAGAR